MSQTSLVMCITYMLLGKNLKLSSTLTMKIRLFPLLYFSSFPYLAKIPQSQQFSERCDNNGLCQIRKFTLQPKKLA